MLRFLLPGRQPKPSCADSSPGGSNHRLLKQNPRKGDKAQLLAVSRFATIGKQILFLIMLLITSPLIASPQISPATTLAQYQNFNCKFLSVNAGVPLNLPAIHLDTSITGPNSYTLCIYAFNQKDPNPQKDTTHTQSKGLLSITMAKTFSIINRRDNANDSCRYQEDYCTVATIQFHHYAAYIIRQYTDEHMTYLHKCFLITTFFKENNSLDIELFTPRNNDKFLIASDQCNHLTSIADIFL